MKATANNGHALEERRKHPRKKVSLPAFVVVTGSSSVHPVTIQDVSSHGLKILAPKNSGLETEHFDPLAALTLLISLPQERAPLAMRCRSCRRRNGEDAIEVGAFFTDSDYTSFDKLQHFLLH